MNNRIVLSALPLLLLSCDRATTNGVASEVGSVALVPRFVSASVPQADSVEAHLAIVGGTEQVKRAPYVQGSTLELGFVPFGSSFSVALDGFVTSAGTRVFRWYGANSGTASIGGSQVVSIVADSAPGVPAVTATGTGIGSSLSLPVGSWFTMDGSDPRISTTASVSGGGAIVISSQCVIRAAVRSQGLANTPTLWSEVRSWSFLDSVARPIIAPDGGSSDQPMLAKVSSATSGAVLHCTTDGSTPTELSPVCPSEGVVIASTLTLKAIATKSGMAPSAVASAGFSITGTVSAPYFDLQEGTFYTAQTVSILDTTAGATIHYTTDGTAPSASSPTYTTPIAINATTIVKAIATKSGMGASAVSSAQYTITGTVATPEFFPPAASYPTARSVTIRVSTSDATIYYTTDGTDPTSNSTPYGGPVLVSTTQILKAIAAKPNWASSAVATGAYTITGTVSAPVLSLASGTYTTGQSVTIEDTTSGAAIYYTTDGTDPTTSSLLYTGSIAINSTTTVKAIAAKDGMGPSAIVGASYVITGTLADPQIAPGTGTYDSGQKVTLSSTDGGAAIHYTTDGTTPTVNSPLYTGGIVLSSSQTIQAIATKLGWQTSGVSSASFTIRGTVAKPVISLPSGTYTQAWPITITTSTKDAVIYYTTDATVPSTASKLYTGPITVSSTTKLRAVAVLAGWKNSPVAFADYSFATRLTGSGAFKDARDGHMYKYTTVGSQVWMAQGLNYSPDGAGVCAFNSADSCTKYGRWYLWSEVMAGASSSEVVPSGVQGICPSGWHVPSQSEWNTLLQSVANPDSAGVLLGATTGWSAGLNGTDEYGFAAMPGGTAYFSTSYNFLGTRAYFWTTTAPAAATALSAVLRSGGTAGAAITSGTKGVYENLRCLEN